MAATDANHEKTLLARRHRDGHVECVGERLQGVDKPIGTRGYSGDSTVTV